MRRPRPLTAYPIQVLVRVPPLRWTMGDVACGLVVRLPLMSSGLTEASARILKTYA